MPIRMVEDITSKVDDLVSSITYNLSGVIKNLLWTLVLEYEKEYNECIGIEEIIRTVIETSFADGPGDETFPNFDREAIEPRLKKIRALLEKKGIASLYTIESKRNKLQC